MRRKEFVYHLGKMTPGEILEFYFEAHLMDQKENRSEELNNSIDIFIRNLEIALNNVLKQNENRIDLENNGGFVI